MQGSELLWPASVRLEAAADSRGNPADPSTDQSTETGNSATPSQPNTPTEPSSANLSKLEPGGCLQLALAAADTNHSLPTIAAIRTWARSPLPAGSAFIGRRDRIAK